MHALAQLRAVCCRLVCSLKHSAHVCCSSGASPASAASDSNGGYPPGSAEAVAHTFGSAFVAALASGDLKWGSNPAVAGLFHEASKMMGLDRQLYSGKTVRASTGAERAAEGEPWERGGVTERGSVLLGIPGG